MDSKSLIDPQIAPMLDVFPDYQFSDDHIVEIRKKMAAMMREMAAPPLDGVLVSQQVIDIGGYGLRLVIYTPENNDNAKKAALLHIHGGGYVVGSPEDFDWRNQVLCQQLGVLVVSVDYRLAPEHPFPRPLEDCYAALKWLFLNAAALAVDDRRIAIYGESSGGGLAAALAILARDRREVQVSFQVLIYPMLDDRTSAGNNEPNPFAGEFVWTHARNYYGWKSLLGVEPGGEQVSPYAAAARLASPGGLPPTYICVGAIDLFVDENIAYAHHLLRAGVPTELHVYPGGFHGFDTVVDSDISKQFYVDLFRALRKALQIAE
jgi:triacylglycerol lipase